MTITACEPTPEKTQTVRGVMGGDGGQFLIIVTEDEYRRLNGDEAVAREKEFVARMHADLPNFPSDPVWTVSPATVLYSLGLSDFDEVEIEIRVRKVGQAERPTYE